VDFRSAALVYQNTAAYRWQYSPDGISGKAASLKGVMNMKTVLLVVVILLALVGVLSIVLYAVHHKASVQIKETSLLPSENIKSEEAVKFAHLTRSETNNLSIIEDQSLLDMTAGAFNPRFEALSSSEQKTLKTSEQQKPELQNMTAGDLHRNAGLGGATWGGVLLAFLLIVILF
jgi:hypothetical protein